MNEDETRAGLIVPRESLKVKLYKFRPLADDQDFERLKEILETGKFYCSKFQDLNDPMEGVYRFLNYTENRAGLIDLIFGEKARYKICSFSNEKAFSNPIMWGYYANGFRGVAVEIEVREKEVKKIKYVDDIPGFKGENLNDEAVKILTTKLSPWGHECEYRFLKKSYDNQHKIGNITALYFGDPYEKAHNRNNIVENSKNIRDYLEFKKGILNITKEKELNVYSVKLDVCSVKIENYKVTKTIPDERQRFHK